MKVSTIKHVTEKMQKIRISKLPREKKYLISQDTRDFIKSNDVEYLGILPLKSNSLPIYNPHKEFFLHQTNILTFQNKMICLPVKNTKKSKLKIIQEFLYQEIQIHISTEKINKILDVENSKVQIYLVNLSNFNLIHTHKKQVNIQAQNTDLVTGIENLSLENNIYLENLGIKNYRFEKILDFYNQIEVRKSIRDMYRNIGRLKQNKNKLQKCLNLKIPDSTRQIQFKYSFIYSRIV